MIGEIVINNLVNSTSTVNFEFWRQICILVILGWKLWWDDIICSSLTGDQVLQFANFDGQLCSGGFGGPEKDLKADIMKVIKWIMCIGQNACIAVLEVKRE